MERGELAQRIAAVSRLTGTFTLRSGIVSDHYFDKFQFEADPQLLQSIAKHLAPLIPSDTDVLAGLELGGVPIAVALGLEAGLPIAYVRKQRKDYGTCKQTEGASVKGKVVCIIEDVITSGGQVVESARHLVAEGANVATILCVVRRGVAGSANSPLGDEYSVTPLFVESELNAAAGAGRHGA
ncbi:MAG TPA: orotate phosphoribosyltransferase [Gemmatimonadaceae bacterium]